MNESTNAREALLSKATAARWEIGEDFHDSLMESIYADAARISSRAIRNREDRPPWNLDHALDRVLTNRWLGYPLMALVLAAVFWITIEGVNVPSIRGKIG
jgi:ferrous iron transport protein B